MNYHHVQPSVSGVAHPDGRLIWLGSLGILSLALVAILSIVWPDPATIEIAVIEQVTRLTDLVKQQLERHIGGQIQI